VEVGRKTCAIFVSRLLSLRYPRRYFSTTHGVAHADFPAICKSIYVHPRCQSASAACRLRQAVIGGSASDRAVYLHRRVIADDFDICDGVLQDERRSLRFSYLHKVACIG
jgi:hypothetical protein